MKGSTKGLPCEVATSHDVVEDEADDDPWNVVQWCRRRDEARAGEDHGLHSRVSIYA